MATIEAPKRKRGRPRKNEVATKQAAPNIVKRKRGRPPKIKKENEIQKVKNVESKIKKQILEKKFEHEFEAKLFINTKPSSRQIKQFDEWHKTYNERKINNSNEKILESIKDLESVINEHLKTTEISKNVFIEIPPIYLVKGTKINFVVFDPFDRGAEVTIKYTGLVPSGASPAVKQTAVCNKITESVAKYIPIGVCC